MAIACELQRIWYRHLIKFRCDILNRCVEMAIFKCLKWRPSVMLDLFTLAWDNPRRVLCGLHRCATFVGVGNRILKIWAYVISILCHFENAYSRLFFRSFGDKWEKRVLFAVSSTQKHNNCGFTSYESKTVRLFLLCLKV